MLPREHYALQHGFATGDRVDAVVRIGDRLVPVDAKFPLENFRRMLEEPDDERRRQLRRAFARDVKTRVDEIAKKYILPDEGTFDFALMYVPAENVYYEIIVRDDGPGRRGPRRLRAVPPRHPGVAQQPVRLPAGDRARAARAADRAGRARDPGAARPACGATSTGSARPSTWSAAT